MLRTLLIANRGEIACRIIRTAREMGIRTIAVFSDVDQVACHVRMADAAIRIGPPAPRDSYLNQAALLSAALRSGADSIHPGYGFLAENAEFASACVDAGLVFVGPSPASIRAMGDKAEAKALMAAAGVPLVPGYHGEDQDDDRLASEAAGIGFPVLIKASAGGGGKGMRVVVAQKEFASALGAARREAMAAFGDARMLVERYLDRPRHVEIQIFGDRHGNVVHLFERDCSIQRRHQKIVEEAPAPNLPGALREAMGAAAVAAARAIDYVGAGTVEFIVADGAFHFMEMNTRLQVEHPVTEAITGIDLVAWQLRIAAGEPLPLRQQDITITGHAIEVRLCAEDPAKEFRPAVGRIRDLALPNGVRVESGIQVGDVVTVDYDSMIAKIIAHGPDRDSAAAQLAGALARTSIIGVRTNLALLRAVVRHPAFLAAAVDTGFLARHREVLEPQGDGQVAAVAAAVLTALAARAAAARPRGPPPSPWAGGGGGGLNLPPMQVVNLRIEERDLAVSVMPAGDGWSLRWEGHAHRAALLGDMLHLDGAARPITTVADGTEIAVVLDGVEYDFVLPDPLLPPIVEAAGSDRVTAPIPGRIAGVLVRSGDVVTKGQALVTLEAMKMEMFLAAERDGVVAELRCAAGERVDAGAVLVVLMAPSS